jgi:hypothetical protein
MNAIAKFFTIYLIVYFPACIGYYDQLGFEGIDELMTFALIAFTIIKKDDETTNPEPWREYGIFLFILACYVAYSLILQVNVAGAVWIEFVQQLRPYSVIYCTWILNPQFTDTQKKWILGSMMVTLFSWIYLHPETTKDDLAEFVVLGQMAMCTGLMYYLFTEESKRNTYIALALVLTGMLAPKFKYMGEVVCVVAMLFLVKKHLNLKTPWTLAFMSLLVVVVLVVTWSRFDTYYVGGWSNINLARPMTYKTSLQILADYFPFGPGMGTFGCHGAVVYYSPLLEKYGLNEVWGMSRDLPVFIADAFYPTLCQYGVVGVFLFGVYWKRRLSGIHEIVDMRYYRVAMIAFLCLAIEQVADTSWLSGKGMGYCMLIGLCLNANRNMGIEEEDEETEGEEELETVEEDDAE